MPFTFTPEQHTVLARVAAGDTIGTAAEAAGVHRNTVLHWRRTSPAFRAEWDSLQFEGALHWREQVLPLAPLAIDAIREILEDPKVSASVRLRAALAIHKIVSTPPPVEAERKSLNSTQAALAYLQQFQDMSESRTADIEKEEEEAAADTVPAQTITHEGIAAPAIPTVPVVQPAPTPNPAQSCTTRPSSAPLTVALNPRKPTLDGLSDGMDQLIEAKRAQLKALKQRTTPEKAA